MYPPESERTQTIRAWLDEGTTELSPRVHDAVIREFPATTQDRPHWSPMMSGPLPVAVATAAVVAFVAIMIGALSLGSPGGPPVVGSPSLTPRLPVFPAVPLNIAAFPRAGATPSDATPGELVLRFEPSTPWMQSWLFADGRLITWRHGFDAGGNEDYIGLIEQRLSPSGVQFLTSEVISTGLFERDLALLWEGAGFLSIDVRNGDQLVRFGWGHRQWGGDWLTAPTATPEEAQALNALTDLLSDQNSWPASAWADRTWTVYVPPSYDICVRGVPDSLDPDDIWTLLPRPARDLRDEAQAPDGSMGGTDDNCTRLTIDEARALARILVGAGIDRQLPGSSGEIWLRYSFEDPNRRGNELWISFGPVLPHGEGVWLGPG